MKLLEALEISRLAKRRAGERFQCFLASGLNPLHLNTLLTAELSVVFPDRKVEVEQGLYGDLQGNVGRLVKAEADVGIVLLEWADLDVRLGVRSSSEWSPSICADILETVRDEADKIERSILQASATMPVVVSFPTLPLLPISFAPGWQANAFAIELDAILYAMRSKICGVCQVRILSAQHLDLISPLKERWDLESELRTGFPYRMPHTSVMASFLARLARGPAPKKGLITDLDDTLWRGILGEIGVEQISWDLDHCSQMHAFYQRLLGELATEGVLLAIASKNERLTVENALTRKDLVVSPNVFFPLEVSWGPKSESVGRILKAWNIGADSVVFVDDNPLELAEVKASHPEVECIQFATNDPAGIYELGLRVRDLFGRSAILEEDRIRAQSIQVATAAADEYKSLKSASPDFLAHVQAEFSMNFDKTTLDPRALELINKTNQFNLNGRRFTETSWRKYLCDPASFLLVTSYTDKFGPLGKIAVIAGRKNGEVLAIDAWVMSCRAFSRRIEYKCVEELFARFGVREIKVDFLHTDRNGPIREFLTEISGEAPHADCCISRERFGNVWKLVEDPEGVMNG